MNYKTLHRKVKIEQHEPKTGVYTGASGGGVSYSVSISDTRHVIVKPTTDIDIVFDIRIRK